MKLAVVLDHEIAHGGGFNQALNAAEQIERLVPGDLALVVVSHPQSIEAVRTVVRAEVVLYRQRLVDRAMALLARLDVTGELQRVVRFVGPFERFLIKHGIDLVYFVTPSTKALALQRLNMITTVWDACHRDMPEFPEARIFGEFKKREYLLRATLPQSVAVVTDSDILSERIAMRYGIDRERLIAMPFSAAPHLAWTGSDSSRSAPRGGGEPFFYYPAQIWPHKNHVRVLEALRLLKERGLARHVVFSGADKGAVEHLRARAQSLGVAELIDFAGFVPPEEMASLYESAAVVVMPSYFGPTNLPPLEAWTMRRPLVCSDVMAEQVADAALVVDPDDPDALARAMASALEPATAARLVSNGLRRLEQLSEARRAAETRLREALERFARRRSCWT